MSALMRPLSGDIQRREYATIDIESKDGDSQRAGFTRPFLAGWYHPSEGYLEFGTRNCIDLALAHACTKEHDGWVFYAHNGGSFDWLHFLPAIERRGWCYELVTAGSSIIMLKVKPSRDSHHKGWTFLDSQKLLVTSLAKSTKSFGVTQKVADFDLNTPEWDGKWSHYLKIDCIALHEVLARFHELVEIRLAGEVGITAASTAMRTFRRGYQTYNIQRHTEHAEFFREAYYGGRVERFTDRAEGLRYYDINSAYPAAMMGDVPVGNAEPWEGEPLISHTTKSLGFCQAKVRIPHNLYIGPLPYRFEAKGGSKKLLFPVGEFSGVWCHDELVRAEECGAIVERQKSVWVERGAALRTMVAALWAYRDKNREDYDEGLAQLAKILLNSLYGKFGMRVERERLVRLLKGEAAPDGARAAMPQDPDCRLYYVSELAEVDYIIPQIAATITCRARLSLHKYLILARSRGSLAYCDTDSIITTADLFDHCSSELGMLKDEGKGQIYEGRFLGPKMYRLTSGDDTKVVMKGFNSRRLEDFERLESGNGVKFSRLEKVGSMAARGFIDGPRMIHAEKFLRTPDTKRIFNGPDSWPVTINTQ